MFFVRRRCAICGSGTRDRQRRRRRFAAQLPLDGEHIPALCDHVIVRIEHTHVQPQVRWQLQRCELRGRDGCADTRGNPVRQPFMEISHAVRGRFGQRRARGIGHGDEWLAQVLRQRAHHLDDLLELHARHEPCEPPGIEHIYEQLGHYQRHTIVRQHRLELVRERQPIAADIQSVRELLAADFSRISRHHIRASHIQQPRRLTLRLATPALEGGYSVHALGNAREIELHERRLVDQNVPPPDLRLERFNFGQEFAIRGEKCGPHI